MHSFLFVPGDSTRKFAKARGGDADALILDLEDSVAASAKAEARDCVADMLREESCGKAIFVRVNALDTDLTLADLAAVMPLAPDGIVLPKCEGPDDLRQLAHYMAAFEASHALPQTRILAIVTETAASLFTLGQYRNVDPRLWGMMWGAEDLAASLGARENAESNVYYEPFRLARNLCLAGAAAAGVVAVDTICAALNDLEALEAEARIARRDGFGAKAVIHPNHIAPVNRAFQPTEEELIWAQKVLDGFEANPNAGVINIDGQMIDKPHERAARRIMAARGPTQT
ncbi:MULTISPECIES: HpcH/HpaI aldolase/citrate lyase family protein [unclassified Sulfitobacter]|uniref:HpcH/HpaI aldolase/citrate lyase family protein n=1 Tax=unclassified Sulfitobacter TaxID=196795 RepID=UPI0007C39FE9|nr:MULTISPECIES: CoA ester lyase [unclassified Sulfitobacter]KZX98851.1 citrate lyase [Sulfitobacter sp. HI0021]KZY01846.1 citrate lyase [Sulfitobacter sp. HI0027]KZZ03198.1 citrate lyase [Sulfitobacter sp. HI0076]